MFFRCGIFLPGTVFGLGLVVFSLSLVTFLAFRHNDGSFLGSGWTASNFLIILTDPPYAWIALRSVLLTGFATLATVVAAYPVYCIAVNGGRYQKLVLFRVILPFWTSYLLCIFVWKIMLAYNGVLNSFLVGAGLLYEPSLAVLNTQAAVVVTFAHLTHRFQSCPSILRLKTCQLFFWKPQQIWTRVPGRLSGGLSCPNRFPVF